MMPFRPSMLEPNHILQVWRVAAAEPGSGSVFTPRDEEKNRAAQKNLFSPLSNRCCFTIDLFWRIRVEIHCWCWVTVTVHWESCSQLNRAVSVTDDSPFVLLLLKARGAVWWKGELHLQELCCLGADELKGYSTNVSVWIEKRPLTSQQSCLSVRTPPPPCSDALCF